MPVCLPNEEYVDYGGVRATATSFKLTESGHVVEENATKSQMSIVLKSDEECEMRLGSKSFETDYELCTFDNDDHNLYLELQGVKQNKTYFSSAN